MAPIRTGTVNTTWKSRDAQQFGLALLHPCERLRTLALGTMPVAAAVVGDLRVRTVLAAHDMAAESRRAAALDRRHHPNLRASGAPEAPGRLSGGFEGSCSIFRRHSDGRLDFRQTASRS